MTGDRPDRRLDAEIESWRGSTPAAPPELRAKVRAVVAEELARREDLPGDRGAAPALRWWLAAAASVTLVALLGYGLLGSGGPVETVSGRLVVADALAAAEAAERDHARAIARLQQAAEPILQRAGRPDTPPEENARLLALRERIASVDAAIAEIEGYLDTNPGLASARTMLLAAYIDKTDLLREVLALDEENEA